MNKSYVVIGGSSGIGRELVQLLEKEGNNVFATYHENVMNSHGNIRYQKLDVLSDLLRFRTTPGTNRRIGLLSRKYKFKTI